MHPETLGCQRDLFDIPENTVFLNCAYMSPLLRQSCTAGIEGLRRKSRPWEITPPDFFATAESVRESAGALLQSSPDNIALIPSASYGLAAAAKNIRMRPGQDIIVLAEEYPSNFYIWQSLAKELKGNLITVSRPTDGDWTSQILNAISETTGLAALPHCHWTDGSLIDLKKIRRALDQANAGLVVDLTQSLGAMNFDTTTIQPDFAVAAAYKWLLGPYSTGIMYVHPKHHLGRPLELNAFARKDAVDFQNLVAYRDEYQPAARRFDMGEMANFALLPALLASLNQLNEWQLPRVEHTLREINKEICDHGRRTGLDILPEPFRSPHFTGLRFKNDVPAGLIQNLADQNIFVSARGQSLRVTPHLYNDLDDVDRFFTALSRLL